MQSVAPEENRWPLEQRCRAVDIITTWQLARQKQSPRRVTRVLATIHTILTESSEVLEANYHSLGRFVQGH